MGYLQNSLYSQCQSAQIQKSSSKLYTGRELYHRWNVEAALKESKQFIELEVNDQICAEND